ncbi:MAG TPA: GAF domain-containing protein [Myxococcales bacterium]|nr:GAF domain-containing protein [Myxococcales bacterium]
MSEQSQPDMLGEQVEALNHKLKTERARFQAIQEIGTALSSTLNLDVLLALIMEKTTKLMDADRSTLFLMDEEKDELWSKVAQGTEQKEIRIAMGEGLAGWVARTGETLNIKDAYKDDRFNKKVDLESGYQTRTILCQPMRNHRGKIIGVMQVLNKHHDYFTVEDELLLSALNGQAAISIENSKLYLNVVGKNIELLDTQERLRQRVAEIDLLFQIEKEMNRAVHVDRLIDSLLRQAVRAIPCQGAGLLFKQGDEWRLFSYSYLQEAGSAARGRIVTPVRGVSMLVAESGTDYRSNEVDHDPKHDPMLTEALDLSPGNAVCVPVPGGTNSLGALHLINRRNQPREGFTRSDLKLLTVIAGQVSSAMLLAQQRTEELNESRLSAIGQALSGVLHDLKTPLTIIGGNAQLMAGEDDATERQESAQVIMRQLVTVRNMTGEILSFARGEANLLLQKVFVRDLMAEIAENLKEQFKSKKMELILELNYADELRVDSAKIQRAFYNLANNARDAMTAGGTFTIESQFDEATDMVVFNLTDTGPGIPEELRSIVFESFVTQGKANGTGLGLAIVKKVVEQHGGTVSFESHSGQGTCFTLRLPRNPNP